nr:FUSC family protein [Cellulomonas endophytica]
MRVRAAAGPVLQAAAAGSVAYAVGREVLGHPAPFFAPVCAWLCLGFSRDRSVRRVAELAVGVAVGVGLGDLIVHVIGTGVWQIGVTLAVAALVARFLDRGPMLTNQAGVQAVVIVGLPATATTGGSLGRWTDALLGGLVALAVAVLTPSDPRRHSRRLGGAALTQVARVLGRLGDGLARRDADDVEDALVLGRSSQALLDEWRDAARNAYDVVRLTPGGRRHRDELRRHVGAAVLADRAMRNTRVLARRSHATLGAADRHPLEPVARTVHALAEAADDLAHATVEGSDPAAVRERLRGVAADLDPYRLGADDWQVQSLVLLTRSLVVDLLEMAGEDQEGARSALPAL